MVPFIFLLIPFNNKADGFNSTFNGLTGCNITSSMKDGLTGNKLNEALTARDVPTSIKITFPNGSTRTLAVDPYYSTNHCILVYGKFQDVYDLKKAEAQAKNATFNPGAFISQDGKALYVGFNISGQPIGDLNQNTINPSEYFYKNSKFVKDPLNNTALQRHINGSTIMPKVIKKGTAKTNTVNGKKLTEAQEIQRTYDLVYWYRSTDGRKLGKQGYLFSTIKTPTEWLNYASVQNYPDRYTFGFFDLYNESVRTPGKFFYSTQVIPAHFNLFDEDHDLKIEVLKVNPEVVTAGDLIEVEFKVTNQGQVGISKPVVTGYIEGEEKNSKDLVHTGILKPNESYTNKLTLKTNANTKTNKVSKVVVEVNKNKKNPTKETDWSNNISKKGFGIINSNAEGSIKIKSHTPTYPKSNQKVDVVIEACNLGTETFENATINLKWDGGKTSITSESFVLKGKIYKLKNGKLVSEGNGDCRTVTLTIDSPEIGDSSKKNNITATLNIPKKPTDSKEIEIRNPNATLSANNQKQIVEISEKEFGDITMTVTNNMFKNIKETCTGSDCNSTSSPNKFEVRFYDITEGKKVEITAAKFNGTYTLKHGEQKTFVLSNSKNEIKKYIDKNRKTNKIFKIKLEANIPYYKGEVDGSGKPKYQDNKEEFELHYVINVPVTSNASCVLAESKSVNHYNLNGGQAPVKMCIGHFPNNPSTLVENGMDSYHYVLYRFFPVPMPNYDVYSPELNENLPDYFYQIIKSINDTKVKGEESAYIFENKKRKRYLPNKVDFSFVIKEDKTNGKQIALGNASHTIPKTCYYKESIDIRQHYGCGEIMFYLPNNSDDFMEEPQNYKTNDTKITDVVYPIKNKKIPYLNPGKYKLELDAKEYYQLYEQTNTSLLKGVYRWSDISKASN